MYKRYYFDTSIWLDLFENRNEPNLQKGEIISLLLSKIIKDNDSIIYCSLVTYELRKFGYNIFEIKQYIRPLNKIIIFVSFDRGSFKRTRDLSAKRYVPLNDALYALIVREQRSVLVTRDIHFKAL